MRGANLSSENVDETLRGKFEAAWRDGSPPHLEDFLSANSPVDFATLLELILIDLELTWRFGIEANVQPMRVEDYLARFPELDSPALIRQLIWQEYYARCLFESAPSRDEYRNRFPRLGLCHSDFPQCDLTSRNRNTRLLEASDRSGSFETLDYCRAAGACLTEFPTGYRDFVFLGAGGMGEVFRAIEVGADKRAVAIKFVKHWQANQAESRKRFQREIAALEKACQVHGAITRVYSYGEIESRPFIVMEYVEGQTLSRQVAESGPLDAIDAARIIETVARAVHATHEAQIIHRDIKPSNILIDSEGRPRLTDFGLAKFVTLHDAEISSEASAPRTGDSLTQTGALAGTHGYIAPEQLTSQRTVDRRADIFSLGATLFHVVVGYPPPRVLSSTSRRQRADIESPSARNAKQPDHRLLSIILKCLKSDPKERYPTAAALAEDLSRYRQRRRTSGAAARIARRLVQRNVIQLLSVGTACFVIAAFVLCWVNLHSFSPNRTTAPRKLHSAGGHGPAVSARRRNERSTKATSDEALQLALRRADSRYATWRVTRTVAKRTIQRRQLQLALNDACFALNTLHGDEEYRAAIESTSAAHHLSAIGHMICAKIYFAMSLLDKPLDVRFGNRELLTKALEQIDQAERETPPRSLLRCEATNWRANVLVSLKRVDDALNMLTDAVDELERAAHSSPNANYWIAAHYASRGTAYETRAIFLNAGNDRAAQADLELAIKDWLAADQFYRSFGEAAPANRKLLAAEHAECLNQLAWYQTANWPGLRNDHGAIRFAYRANLLTEYADYRFLDTLAAALRATDEAASRRLFVESRGLEPAGENNCEGETWEAWARKLDSAKH